jgi:cytochrome c oxidase subunit 1
LWEKDFPVAVVRGLPEKVRTALVTHLHDAQPDHVTVLPTPSVWPLLAALATTAMFIGSIFTPWALVWGSIPVAITLIGWFWPREDETRLHCEIEVKPDEEQARVEQLRELMS